MWWQRIPRRGGSGYLVLRSSMRGLIRRPEVGAVVVIDHAEAVVRPAAGRRGRGAQDPQAGRGAARPGGLDPAGADHRVVLERAAGAGHRRGAGLQSKDGAPPVGPLRRRRAGRARCPARRRPQTADRPGPALPADRPGGQPAAGPGSPRRGRRADRRRRHGAGGVDPECAHHRGPGGRHRHRPLPGAPDPAGRRGALASSALVGGQRRSGVRPKRTRVVDYYIHPPPNTTVIAADELGPVTPRTFDPSAGWSTDGHRPKAPLSYSRGPDKTWIYGGVRIGDGQAVTCCAPSRNSACWQAFLVRLEQANPTGTIAVITDNLSSHSSLATRAWLTGHPRLEQVFIPKGACWLQPAGGLVAHLPPACPGRADLRRPGRDRPRHRTGHRPAEHPRQTLGLGTATATATTPPTALHLPALRNEAVSTATALEGVSLPESGEGW